MFGSRPRRFNAFTLLAFVAGAATGGAIALLYAPTTGRKLQKQLKSVLDDQVETVQSAMKRVVA